MLHWAFIFLIISIISGIFEFTGVSIITVSIAKFFFFFFFALFLLALTIIIFTYNRFPPVE